MTDLEMNEVETEPFTDELRDEALDRDAVYSSYLCPCHAGR